MAEYNPLHKGHLYHISMAAKDRDDALVAVLSSYFTQRGEPALLSKWDRAETALGAGINLVLELPAFFSCHNGGVFAGGAVDILAAAGVVDIVSFGMERPDFNFASILSILVQEPTFFKDNLKKYLNSGYSYVKARAAALDNIQPGWGAFVSTPNNSLALSYMERILKRGYRIGWRPVRRAGAGYLDENAAAALPSATAIRKALYEGRDSDAEQGLPPSTCAVLERCMDSGRAVLSSEKLWRLARFLLMRTPREELATFSGMTEGIENRLKKYAPRCSSWEEFVSACTTARYPAGRIRRQLIHFLLGIKQEENRALQESGPAYIRVLGADQKGMEILRRMRDGSTLPVLGKAPVKVPGPGGTLARIERSACDLWEEMTEKYSPGLEKKRRTITAEYFGEGESAP
ncbi:MAG: nucleotidyltransferase family protein [Synergistaceae bacterium]|nr:nucleotidyltransferase family protein [Synergistaceae bacterium]